MGANMSETPSGEPVIRKKRGDEKFFIPRSHPFSDELAVAFERGETPSFEEIWKHGRTKKLYDDEKKDNDIIQFSYLIRTAKGLQYIRRGPSNQLTTGISVLQSRSPTLKLEYGFPRRLTDVAEFLHEDVDLARDSYDLSFLGIARNVNKGIRYYFFVFIVDLKSEDTPLSSKEGDLFLGDLNPVSPTTENEKAAVEDLRSKRADLAVLSSLYPEFRVTEAELLDCRFLREHDCRLEQALFTVRNPPLVNVRAAANLKPPRRKGWVRIAIVQITYPLEGSRRSAEFAYFPPDHEQPILHDKVFGAIRLARQAGAEIALLPELSVVPSWEGELIASSSGLILIAGSYYQDSRNVCPIIVDGQLVYRYAKVHPSPYEEGAHGWGMWTGVEIPCVNSSLCDFVVLICSDYTLLASGIVAQLRERNVRLLFVPQYNASIETFHKWASNITDHDPKPYVVMANGADSQGSCVFGVDNDSFNQVKRDAGLLPPGEGRRTNKLLECKGEMTAIVDLDLDRYGVPVNTVGGSKCKIESTFVWSDGGWREWNHPIWPSS